HGVRPTRAAPAQPRPGAQPLADLPASLGIRLRARLQLARRVRRLPAPQDGGGRRAPPHPERPGRGFHAAAAVTLRARLTLVSAGLVAAALVVAGIVIYASTAVNTRAEVDDSLRRQAAAIATGGGAATTGSGAVSDGQLVDQSGQVTPLRPDSLT